MCMKFNLAGTSVCCFLLETDSFLDDDLYSEEDFNGGERGAGSFCVRVKSSTHYCTSYTYFQIYLIIFMVVVS